MADIQPQEANVRERNGGQVVEKNGAAGDEVDLDETIQAEEPNADDEKLLDSDEEKDEVSLNDVFDNGVKLLNVLISVTTTNKYKNQSLLKAIEDLKAYFSEDFKNFVDGHPISKVVRTGDSDDMKEMRQLLGRLCKLMDTDKADELED